MKYILSLIAFFIQLTLYSSANAENEWFSVESAMRNVSITGFTRARSKMPLTAEVEGKVNEVFADIGEAIPETKIFACLDDEFAKIDIRSARNEIGQQKVDIDFFTKQVDRHKKLVSKQTSAVSVLDGLIRDLENSKRALSAAYLRKLRLLEHKKRHCIEAPEGWLVIDRKVEPGQWVSRGDVLANIGNYTQLKVPLSLTQHELNALKKSKDKLELYLTDLKVKVPAAIVHISPGFDENTRKVMVDLLIKKSSADFYGGMRVELKLKTPNTKSSAFRLSKLALEERFEEYWILRKDGKRIRVKLLSSPTLELVTISSSEIKLGDQFKRIKK